MLYLGWFKVCGTIVMAQGEHNCAGTSMWWDLYQAIAKQGRDDCANITLNIIYLPLTMGLAMQNVIYLWWLKLYGAILLINVSHRVAKLLDHI